jgi:Uma2 family endonuclease
MAAITVPEPIIPFRAPADEPLYEVVRGESIDLPPMAVRVSHIKSRLNQILGSFVNANKLGRVEVELLFLIDRVVHNERRPDVAFVSYERWPRERGIPNDSAWGVVPDLAIEIVSPTDRAEAALDKIREYFESGVRAVWSIYPNLRLAFLFDSLTSVRMIAPNGELDGGVVVPGFRLSMTTLFEDVTGGSSSSNGQ